MGNELIILEPIVENFITSNASSLSTKTQFLCQQMCLNLASEKIPHIQIQGLCLELHMLLNQSQMHQIIRRPWFRLHRTLQLCMWVIFEHQV